MPSSVICFTNVQNDCNSSLSGLESCMKLSINLSFWWVVEQLTIKSRVLIVSSPLYIWSICSEGHTRRSPPATAEETNRSPIFREKSPILRELETFPGIGSVLQDCFIWDMTYVTWIISVAGTLNITRAYRNNKLEYIAACQIKNHFNSKSITEIMICSINLIE